LTPLPPPRPPPFPSTPLSRPRPPLPARAGRRDLPPLRGGEGGWGGGVTVVRHRSSLVPARSVHVKELVAGQQHLGVALQARQAVDRKSTRLNSSHLPISYAVF